VQCEMRVRKVADVYSFCAVAGELVRGGAADAARGIGTCELFVLELCFWFIASVFRVV